MGNDDGGGIIFTRVSASAGAKAHFEDVTVDTTPVVFGPGLDGVRRGVRRFGPGSVFLADDTTGQGHQTGAVGTGGCFVVWVACE